MNMENNEVIEKIEDLNSNTHMDGFKITTNLQEITLGIENDSGCCERWGHFFCNDEVEEFVGAKVLGVSLTDTALHNHIVKEKMPEDLDSGGVMFVNIETDQGVLQFVAYNSHNGYYGHQASVTSKQLTHQEYL